MDCLDGKGLPSRQGLAGGVLQASMTGAYSCPALWLVPPHICFVAGSRWRTREIFLALLSRSLPKPCKYIMEKFTVTQVWSVPRYSALHLGLGLSQCSICQGAQRKKWLQLLLQPCTECLIQVHIGGASCTGMPYTWHTRCASKCLGAYMYVQCIHTRIFVLIKRYCMYITYKSMYLSTYIYIIPLFTKAVGSKN